MAKKNKDIEVRLEETTKHVNGTSFDAVELYIGKKNIGEVVSVSNKEYWVMMDNERQVTVRSLDEGLEWVIRQWNLQE